MKKIAPIATVVLNEHKGDVHDADLDYCGRRLATCSSDGTIKIYSLNNGKKTLLADIKDHYGPVWQVCWSHPKTENLLASCSYDRRAMVWKECNNNRWSNVFEYSHKSSVNAITWAPHQLGIIFASASACGSVAIHVLNNKWFSKLFFAHNDGCNTVAWIPFKNQTNLSKNFVIASGGCDNLVKIWNVESDLCEQIGTIKCHTSWVRDLAWTYNVNNAQYVIASGSEDKTVVVSYSHNFSEWTSTLVHSFNGRVWSVSWSNIGYFLAVSAEKNTMSLWKENKEGQWFACNELDEDQKENDK